MAAYFNASVDERASMVGRDDSSAGLPKGSCNFRDLTSGTKAPTCGCRRFWLDTSKVVVGGTEKAWCFCGHHACFHNAFAQQQRGQITIHAPTDAPQRPVSIHAPIRELGPEHQASPQRTAALPKPNSGLGIRPDSRQQTQSVNTRLWDALNNFAREQEDGNYSDTTSKLPSTAVPSIAGGDEQLTPNQLLADRLQYCQPLAPPLRIAPGLEARPDAPEYQGSATEVATPSIAGTPDLRAFAPPGSQRRVSPAHNKMLQDDQCDARSAVPAAAATSVPTAKLQSTVLPSSSQQAQGAQSANPHSTSNTQQQFAIQELLRSYGHRLEVLENLSFNQVPLDEIHDRFDLQDGRLLDLEHWRAEREKQASAGAEQASSSSEHRRALASETSSFSSDLSFDEQAAIHAEAAVLATLAANAETGPRIDALESRIEDLENAALPSYQRPWHVEVVLLPWSRDLRGIWFSSIEASQQFHKSQLPGVEEWTGTDTITKSSFRSSVSAAWTTESIQAWAEEAQDWLSPKACGPTGSVYQRLASRGLIKDVTIAASESRHILDAISAAFSHVSAVEDHSGDRVEIKDFRGLREQFIPLRKARKSSRLRFLNPSEMVTSATWTASFLDASVMMKVQQQHRRLYVTTPEAYLQATRGAWSWPKVKALSPCGADGEFVAAQQESPNAIEACWTYHERLDCPPSLSTSFATQASQESHENNRSQASMHELLVRDAEPSGAPSEPRHRYHLRKRTVSLPLSSSSRSERAITRPELSKRRVASFEAIQTAPMSSGPLTELTASKRRRISVSPEAERKGVYFTPRWSREPPSPFTSDMTGVARSQATSSSRLRGNTPFAYATPHSNNFAGNLDLSGGADGDTVHDSEVGKAGPSEQGDEEWNGVEDDMDFIGTGDSGDDEEHE